MKSPLVQLHPSEFTLLRNFIGTDYGIVINEDMDYFLESQLCGLLPELGCKDYRELYQLIKTNKTPELRTKIITAITIYDTKWFDNENIWRALKDVLLPQYIDALRSGKKDKIVIWSAAASTGQEPYSVAMLVDEAVYKEPKIRREQFIILASDISPSALFMAVSGRYPEYLMTKGYVYNFKDKFFTTLAGISEINPDIKRMVTFFQANVAQDLSKIPNCDLILFRNVEKYLKTEHINRIYKKLFSILQPNGHLFLGDNESINDYSIGYIMVEDKIYHKSG